MDKDDSNQNSSSKDKKLPSKTWKSDNSLKDYAFEEFRINSSFEQSFGNNLRNFRKKWKSDDELIDEEE